MDDIVPITQADIAYIMSPDFSAPITQTLNDVRVERLSAEIYKIYLEKGKGLLSKPSLRLLSRIRANNILYGLTYNNYMMDLIRKIESNDS